MGGRADGFWVVIFEAGAGPHPGEGGGKGVLGNGLSFFPPSSLPLLHYLSYFYLAFLVGGRGSGEKRLVCEATWGV